MCLSSRHIWNKWTRKKEFHHRLSRRVSIISSTGPASRVHQCSLTFPLLDVLRELWYRCWPKKNTRTKSVSLCSDGGLYSQSSVQNRLTTLLLANLPGCAFVIFDTITGKSVPRIILTRTCFWIFMSVLYNLSSNLYACGRQMFEKL